MSATRQIPNYCVPLDHKDRAARKSFLIRLHSAVHGGGLDRLQEPDLVGEVSGLCRLAVSSRGSALVKVCKVSRVANHLPVFRAWALSVEEKKEAWRGRVWFTPGDAFFGLDLQEPGVLRVVPAWVGESVLADESGTP